MNPWPLRFWCSALLTKLTSQLGASHHVVPKSTREVTNKTTVNIWKSYIWIADKDKNMKAIFAVMNLSSSENKAWLHGFIWDQHDDQFPVSLLAQLVERCIGIAEVT